MTVINKCNWPLAIGSIAFIFIICTIVAINPAFNVKPFASTGIAIDLTITTPFVYFLFIHKTQVSKITIFRVFIAGFLLASFLLHNKNILYLATIKKWIVPIIELSTIAFIGIKFYNAKTAAKYSDNNPNDFLQYCRIVLLAIIGNQKLAAVLASEFSVFYYLFKIGPNKIASGNTAISYHKKTNARLLVASFLLLIFIETIAFHFLLSSWNKTAAWLFTGLSIYTSMQLLAHIKAMKHRPILVSNNLLCLKNGLAGEASIDYNNIKSIQFDNKNIVGKEVVKLCLFKKIEKHNITIYVKQPVDAIRMFGIKKKTTIILLHVDNASEFKLLVESKMQHN